MKIGFWKTKFYLGDVEVSSKEMEKRIAPLPKAYKHWKKANTTDILSFLPSLVGGYFVGKVVGTELSGRSSTRKDVILGLSGLVIGGTLSAVSTTHRRSALSLYNESLSQGINIRPSAMGIGLVLNF